jgi:hypothetical protein
LRGLNDKYRRLKAFSISTASKLLPQNIPKLNQRHITPVLHVAAARNLLTKARQLFFLRNIKKRFDLYSKGGAFYRGGTHL